MIVYMTEIEEEQFKISGLTNCLHLNFCDISAVQALTITKRSRLQDHLFLSLANAAKPKECGDMRLWWFLKSGGNYYCIVVQQAWLFEDDPMPSYTVQRVVNQNKLHTISENELQQISVDCRKAIGSPHTKESELGGILGTFAEVEI